MTDMSMVQNGNGVPPSAAPDTATLVAGMLDTMTVLNGKAAMDTSAAEAKDRTSALLNLAQAIVVLDPSLNQQGIPIEHEMALEALRQGGQERLEKARQAAAAPTPKKRRLRRTSDGYEMEG